MSDDERIKARLIESLDAELGARLEPPAHTAVGLGTAGEPARPRRSGFTRVAPFAAAAAVAAVGVTVAVVVSSSGSTAPSPAGPGPSGVRVTCTADAGANPSADRDVLLARAGQLIPQKAAGPTATVSGSSIMVTVPGATRSAVAGLCSSASVQLRPLVAPAVAVSPRAAPAALTRLGFDLPANEHAYDRLPPAQQKKLSHAVARSGCARADDADGPVVACGDGVDGLSGRAAMLLGAPIVTGSHVANAHAVPPNPAQGQPGWTVSLNLDHTGDAAWGAYTSAHNVSGVSESDGSANAAICASEGSPCADWVGFVVDGSVVSLPVNEGPISGGTTQISGSFGAKTAKDLATDLRGGRLPVPLQLTSVTATG